MERMIGEVAQKHGLLLSRDDPVLVSVTLNEQILSQALGQLRGSLEQAKQEIGELSAKQTEAAKTIAEQLITAAAGYIADEVRAAAADITANTDNLSNRGSAPESSRAHQASWLAAAIAISAACVSCALAIAGPVFLENEPAFANCQVSKP
jgi:membrane protease subunit (stomatin/prohibitin family)